MFQSIYYKRNQKKNMKVFDDEIRLVSGVKFVKAITKVYVRYNRNKEIIYNTV